MARKMSLPTGRGDQRVRSWGRAKKREGAGRLCGKQGDHEDIASPIGVLLSLHSTGCSKMRMNGREHKTEGKTCQSNILWRQREQKIDIYTPIEIS
jgi:hypothetical protein